MVRSVLTVLASAIIGVVLVEVAWSFLDPKDDGSYLWQDRYMLFDGGSVFRNVDGFFTYQPNQAIRSATFYDTADGWTKEYDYLFRSNNLGLVQSRDTEPERPSILFLGDSFTEGQGAVPWLDVVRQRIEVETGLQPVNGGLLGTGFEQWALLHEHLLAQGVRVERLVVIFISHDFRRKPWQFPARVLDCLAAWQTCDGSEGFYGLPPEAEVGAFLDRLREARSAQGATLKQRLKRLLPATHMVYRVLSDALSKGRPQTETIETFIGLYGDRVVFVHLPQKDEVRDGMAPLGREARKEISERGGRLYDGFEKCGLSLGDFHTYDGHPNERGYGKISACVVDAVAR